MNAMKGLERPGYSVLSASDKGGSWPSRGDLRRGGAAARTGPRQIQTVSSKSERHRFESQVFY